jgi:Putative lumazine-binding
METHDFQGVADALVDYFDGIYDGDLEALSRILHPCLTFYCATDGVLEGVDRETYFQKVRERPSPASRNDPRYDEIVSIDFAGPVTAHVKLRCAYLPRMYTDFHTLVHLDGAWRVVAKVYHYELAPDA